MSDGFVYNQYLGELDTLDGVTCGIALFDGTYVPNRASTTVGSLTGELTGGSYTRQTFAASYAIESNDGVLRIDEADQWPLFDIAGKAWQYAVFYKNSDGTVISYLPYSPQIGTDNMPIQPLNGFARAANGAGLAARIAALEEAVDGIESGVPTVIAGGNAAVQGVQIQDRSDVALAWTTANPVLALGERGDESDTGLFKIGDSATAWNDLGYAGGGPGDWTALTLPAEWANAADVLSDPTLAVLAVRTSAARTQVEARARLIIGPADLVAGLTIGRIGMSAVIPAAYRPATLESPVPAQLTVVVDFTPTLVEVPVLALVQPSGNLEFEIGTHLADGTSISTLFDTGGDWETSIPVFHLMGSYSTT